MPSSDRISLSALGEEGEWSNRMGQVSTELERRKY